MIRPVTLVFQMDLNPFINQRLDLLRLLFCLFHMLLKSSTTPYIYVQALPYQYDKLYIRGLKHFLGYTWINIPFIYHWIIIYPCKSCISNIKLIEHLVNTWSLTSRYFILKTEKQLTLLNMFHQHGRYTSPYVVLLWSFMTFINMGKEFNG